MRLTLRITLLLISSIIAGLALAAQAQIPDKFTNLKVFPKDIEKRALVDRMKSFTRALGVRCNHCHDGTGDDLSTFDFASDEKEEKRITRRMMQMTHLMNEEFLKKLESRTPEQPAVTCWTCHRGEKVPVAIAPPRESPAPAASPAGSTPAPK